MKSLTESPHPNGIVLCFFSKMAANILIFLKNWNIVVGLVGVNTDESKGELFIVTEFCGGGACDEYVLFYI